MKNRYAMPKFIGKFENLIEIIREKSKSSPHLLQVYRVYFQLQVKEIYMNSCFTNLTNLTEISVATDLGVI